MSVKIKSTSKKKLPESNTTKLKIFGFIKKVTLWFFAVSVLLVLVFKFVPVPFTPLMITRAIEQKLDGKEMTCSHDWVSIDEISPNLQKAVIASEDGTFMQHRSEERRVGKEC